MVEKTVLDSGLVVLSESIPALPSFSLSYTLRGGSRAETAANNGIHHFIEHMLFKGTPRYDLKQIADVSDRLGGQLNAFTSKEVTQFYIKAIDEKLDESFDLLTEMVIRSTFPAEDFIKERSVVVQEINESEDNPDTHSFETFYEDIFPGDALGFPIGGKEKQVAGFEREMVYHYYKRNYAPDNLVLAAVGNVEHQRLVQLADDAFNRFPNRPPREFAFPASSFQPKIFGKKNPSLKQIYALMAFDAPSAVSLERHAFSILNDVLGGGMSSRLFQSIREDKGLAYTVNSFTDNYLDCGLQLVYSIIEKEKSTEYLDAVKHEISRMKREGINEEELNRSRDHIKASVILGLESSTSRMRFHVNNELNLEREFTIEEIVEKINGVTRDDIHEMCRSYLDMDRAAVFLYGDVADEG